MKAGVASWRALRSFQDPHPAWAHLGGRPQQECDLPRPISTSYKSVYNQAAAAEARAALEQRGNSAAGGAGASAAVGGGAAGGERLRISFEPAQEPRTLRVKSWKDVGRDDLAEWYLDPPGQPLSTAESEGGSCSAAHDTTAAGDAAQASAKLQAPAGGAARVTIVAVAE